MAQRHASNVLGVSGDAVLDDKDNPTTTDVHSAKDKSLSHRSPKLLYLTIFIVTFLCLGSRFGSFWKDDEAESRGKKSVIQARVLKTRDVSEQWTEVFEKTENMTYGLSPPWYPSPKGGSISSWSKSYEKAQILVEQMSLIEKINITTGTGWMMGLAVGNTGPANHVGFPSLALQDGPSGIRYSQNSTAFPAGITVGATWNKELMYLRGKAHGKEARLKGINVILGPCVGPIGRMPAGGRGWEGFGTDPALQGIAAAQTIKGIQEEGVMATVKHLVGNEQEHYRQTHETRNNPYAYSSNIDDRTLHELYGWPFQNSVKAGVASVMCSYNMVNVSYACENSKLMNGYLKDELGFSGFVQSDWLAQRSGVASALAGLDMSMPGDGLDWADGKSLWGPELAKSILNGSLPIERLNDMVTRVVAAWYQLGQDDLSKFDRKGPNFSSWTFNRTGHINEGSPDDNNIVVVNQFVDVQGTGNESHSIIAHQVAVEGTILLKNTGILPLSQDGLPITSSYNENQVRIGIFGEDAGEGEGPNFCADRGCNQGTLGIGWGSGSVEFPYLISPAAALKKAFNKDKVNLTVYATNNPPFNTTPAILNNQDLCIVFTSVDSGEGYITYDNIEGDRNDLFLQKGGDQLIRTVADGCDGGEGSTIVVIHSVGPVILESFDNHPNVKAIIWANLPGQESGNALTDIIMGKSNPSGKLPYTIAKSPDDYGAAGKILFNSTKDIPMLTFKEGLYIDYRHFDKYDIQPAYPFGYGLSYTNFEYSNLVITQVLEKTEFPGPRPRELDPPIYYSTIPDANEVLFPDNILKLTKFVYPYISNTSEVRYGPYPYPSGYYDKQNPSPAGGDEGGHPDLWKTHATVAVDITNTGNFAGKEAAQVYVSFTDAAFSDSRNVDFPVKVLRQFEKVHLEIGETQTVQFNLTRRDLSYWDVERQNWAMPTVGSINIHVGASSRDIRLSGCY
ncbi:putative beta-glucosidase E [Golovinomyces cichoracearum]|uniref:Probable beta-glucosidase E n=1 Tax=Golovinomyces cichoracearum TaxID=62708 RepID=A0A420J8D2_9PEZI|nr:putative beta-glucosidase E [Golovinomyces cichoracearum]